MSSSSPNIQIPSLAKAIQEESDRQLAEIKPQQIAGPDDAGAHAHGLVADSAHITEKIYLFPESYNALRRELHDNWPSLWMLVGWAMAHQAETFVEIMNDALDLKLQLDGNKVGATCHIYLNALRAKRGLSAIPGTGAD